MSYRVVSPADYTVTPWRNGQGETVELLKQGSSDAEHEFDWRISKAPVSEDGPFSTFTGCERILVLIKGKGATLQHDSGEVDCLRQVLDIARFRGEWHTMSTLVDGDVTNFNLITRRDACTAEVQVVKGTSWQEIEVSADTILAYSLEDSAEFHIDAEVVHLPGDHLLQIDSAQALQCKGEKIILFFIQ